MAHDDPDFVLKLGDTREKLRGTLKDALGQTVPASSVTGLKFRMKRIGEAAWTIDLPADVTVEEKAEYDWTSDLAFPESTGFYHAQFHGTVNGGHQSFPTDGSMLIKVSD